MVPRPLSRCSWDATVIVAIALPPRMGRLNTESLECLAREAVSPLMERHTPYIPNLLEGEFRSVLEGLARGQGGIWAVAGAPGIGKSTFTVRAMLLASEVVPGLRCAATTCMPRGHSQARGLAGLVGVTRAGIVPSDEPYRPFIDILAKIRAIPGTAVQELRASVDPGERLKGAAGRIVVEVLKQWLVPAPLQTLEVCVRELMAIRETSWDEGLRANSNAIRSTLEATLHRFAAEQPLILLLDDAHFMDPPSCQVLASLAQKTHDLPLLLLVVYREQEVDVFARERGHPLLALVNRGVASGFVTRKRIEPWSERDTEQYVGEAYAPYEWTEGFLERLMRWTGGLPLFVYETLKLLEARGDLLQSADGRWRLTADLSRVVVPERVEEAIKEQLGLVASSIRKTLEHASVEGERFHEEVLRILTDPGDADELGNQLDAAASYHRLIRLERDFGARPLGFTYRFAHALVHEVVYRLIPERRLPRLHRLVAQRLVHLVGNSPGPHAGTIAEHFERGEDVLRASRYYAVAAEHSLELYDSDGALDRAERGIRILGSSGAAASEPELVHELEHARGVALYRLARWAEARAVLRTVALQSELRGAHETASDAWRLLAHIANVQEDLCAAEEFLDRASDSARRADDGRRRLLAAIGRHRLADKWSAARREALYSGIMRSELSEILGIALATGDRALEIRARRWLGRALANLGDLDSARAYCEEARSLAQSANDPRLQIEVNNLLQDIEVRQERMAEALRIYEQSVTAARNLGDPLVKADVLNGYGARLKELGRWEEAREQIEEALLTAQEAGLTEQQCISHGLLADLFGCAGEPTLSERHHQAHRDTSKGIGDRGGYVSGGVGLAEALIARREAGLALQELALLGVSAADGMSHFVHERIVRASAMEQLGRGEEALSLLNETERAASTLGDDYWRGRLDIARSQTLRSLGRGDEARASAELAVRRLQPMFERWKSAELGRRLGDAESERDRD